MKKISALLVIVFFTLLQVVAQEPIFVKGDKVINLGIGFGSGSYSGVGAVFLTSFEAGIVDNVINKKGVIGVGGCLGYTSYTNSGEWRSSEFIIAGRGALHYPFVKKLDTYGGVMLGYGIYSYKWVGSGTETFYDGSTGSIISTFYAGAGYHVSKSFAVMSELGLGYNLSYLSVGVSFKF